MNKKYSNTWFKKHWHNYFEIIYYRNCEGYCILNGQRHELTENCLFLLTPKDFHEIVTKDLKGSYSIIISFTEQAVDDRTLDALTATPIVLHSLPPALNTEIEELYEIFIGKERYRDWHLSHLLNCILITVLERGQPVVSAVHDVNPIVRESISYMLTNPAEHITLEALAAKFGITKTYFSHLFKNCTGISFKQYLLTLRIEYAKRMLEERDLSVLDICYECGFNTPSQFTRAFEQRVGCSPSEYRKRKARPR